MKHSTKQKIVITLEYLFVFFLVVALYNVSVDSRAEIGVGQADHIDAASGITFSE